MKTLYVIPARGGSKGIPGKNIRPLNGKPLIHYSIEYARSFTSDENICLTTDDKAIALCAQTIGYKVPFFRPKVLAQDNSGTFEVIAHAIDHYLKHGLIYENVVLLQPTSPFRLISHLKEALSIYTPEIDMIVSVKASKESPYFTIFEENECGFLKISKINSSFVTRQEVPKSYTYNGSIYILNPASFNTYTSFNDFQKVKKYLMSDIYSLDIDTLLDWSFAEFLITTGRLNIYNGKY